MGGWFKCADPDDANKFLLIRDGDIVFYENVNGSPTPVTPITQISLHNVTSGGSVTPSARYAETPEVFVQPRSIRTFDIDASAMDQTIEIDSPTVTALSNEGQYKISVSGGLTASSGYTAVAPLETYRTNDDDENPTWAVPVAGITAATVYGYAMGFFQVSGSSSSTFYAASYTFRAGIGGYQSGADYWGTSATGSCSGSTRVQVAASVSGSAGNYLHIAASFSKGSAISSPSGYYRGYGSPTLRLFGARCKGGGEADDGSPAFTAVVVGR